MYRKLVAVALSLICFAAFGNEVRRMSMKEHVSRSDLIVIGAGSGSTRLDDSNDGYVKEVAVLEVHSMIKGAPSPSVSLVTKGQFIELDVDCCEKGVTYLVFAKRTKYGEYIPTNGQYSVVKIAGDRVLNWGDGCPSQSLKAVLQDLREMANE